MATHALIPLQWRESLNAVVEATGIPQRELVTRAAEALLSRADNGFIPDTPPMPKGSLVALVARIPRTQQQALHTLAGRTRIRYSEWLRQAVVDVLRAHGAMPPDEPVVAKTPAAKAAVTTPSAGARCMCGFLLRAGEGPACEDCCEVAP